MKLKATFVKNVKPFSSRVKRYGDGANGLMLVVNPGGPKNWVQRISIQGKQRDLGLGGFPLVSLSEARRAALVNRKAIRVDGIDPRRKRTPSFQSLAREHLKLHSPTWSAATLAMWTSALETHAYPKIGSQPVDKIEVADVLRTIRPLLDSKPSTAAKLKRMLASIFDAAIARGYRGGNPCATVDALLPKVKAKRKHFAAMPYQDVPAAMAKIRASTASASTRGALEFLILTATRKEETLGARWSEIEGDVWTIPAARTKARKEHRVPLSKRALELLGDQQQDGYLFPGRKGKLDGTALWRLMKREGLPGTVHGFRSSFRDWCSESGVARELAELCLAHRIGSAVEQAYNRTSMVAARREVMELWSTYLKA